MRIQRQELRVDFVSEAIVQRETWRDRPRVLCVEASQGPRIGGVVRNPESLLIDLRCAQRHRLKRIDACRTECRREPASRRGRETIAEHATRKCPEDKTTREERV